jgi:hypothetical protein
MTISSAIPVDAHNKMLNTSLEVEDPEMFALVQHEKWRQFSCLELIASEVRLNHLNHFYSYLSLRTLLLKL